MPRMSMGTDTTMSVKEVAELLGITPQRVYQMREDGVLRDVNPTGKARFDAYDVEALAEERERGPMTPTEMRRYIVRLLAGKRRHERRIKSLERMMGLRARHIGDDEVEILGLYYRAKEAVKEPLLDAVSSRFWYETLLAIHEEFFDLVELYSRDPEPWRPFVVLAQKMYEKAPPVGEFYDEEVVANNAELEVARRNVRAAAWIYLCNRRGRAYAEAQFPDTHPDPITHLLRDHVLLHP